jgi:hypothetical protein
MASAANLTPGRVIARLWYLRAQALIALGQAGEAEAVLNAAQVAAREHGTLALLWRIQAALGTQSTLASLSFVTGHPQIKFGMTHTLIRGSQ